MPSCGSPICHSLAIKRGPKYATLILAAAFILTVVRSFAMLQMDLETVHIDSELHSLQVYGFYQYLYGNLTTNTHKILKILKNLGGSIHTLYTKLTVRYGNYMQNTEKSGYNYYTEM